MGSKTIHWSLCLLFAAVTIAVQEASRTKRGLADGYGLSIILGIEESK